MIVKKYERRADPIEVIEVKDEGTLNSQEVKRWTNHLVREDTTLGRTYWIFDSSEQMWYEIEGFPCVIARRKDGSFFPMTPGELVTWYKQIESGPPMPAMSGTLVNEADVPQWVRDVTTTGTGTRVGGFIGDRKCCCCGSSAGPNGYCGPSGCYDRPA